MPTTSVQLYSLRDAIAADLDSAIARVREIGYEHVEPYAFVERAADLERAFAATGLQAPSGHVAVIDAEDTAPIWDAAERLGIRTVIDPFIPTDRWQTADDVARIAERVNELTAEAAARGLQFGYHNHQWEFTNKVDGRTVYDLFVSQLSPETVLEVDTFWATVGGADAPAVLRALGDRVVAIHVKDGKVDGDIRTALPSSESALIVPEALQRAFENQTPAGQGDVDVAGILAAAPQAIRVVEFDAYQGDVFEGIAESFRWLQANDTAGGRRVSRVGIGVIGAGNISTQYLANLTQFADVEVRFVADVLTDRAAAQAEQYGVGASGTVEELLARDDVSIVINLTIPAAHAEVDQQVIDAGKHVWSEKPIATDHDSAAAVLASAQAKGLRVATAPDTVLGAGIQTALRAIARGDIGEPLSATTMFHVPGPEAWHPNPDFLFATGAGPLFDMGPYYVTTLVHAFGAASRVQAVSSKSLDRRTIASGDRAGETFPVEVPTHHAALIEFAGGQSAQSTFSFQHALPRQGFVEINGTLGTISLPDPNTFEGSSQLWRFGQDEPETLEAVGSTWGRGTGVVELARAIAEDRPERASGAVALHVLDVLLGIRDAAESGSAVTIESTVERPAPLPEDFDPAAAVLTR